MGWLDQIVDNLMATPVEEMIWIGIGLLGQALFSMRFIIQWIVSEKKRDSVIPIAFWYFSIGGGLVMLSYAIWRADPVFILGQSTGLFIYLRNLYFILKRRRAELEVPDPTTD
ncbi:lipid-A-disaccharide synthase N-terminal domain-containing protein [Pacificispira spongiicola]|nr:lipid-A-disaccharide synthase N-terminal domain-containing protein [Pacificispira spongiicola]